MCRKCGNLIDASVPLSFDRDEMWCRPCMLSRRTTRQWVVKHRIKERLCQNCGQPLKSYKRSARFCSERVCVLAKGRCWVYVTRDKMHEITAIIKAVDMKENFCVWCGKRVRYSVSKAMFCYAKRTCQNAQRRYDRRRRAGMSEEDALFSIVQERDAKRRHYKRLARVHTIKKARKVRTCGKCGDSIEVGSGYKYWEPRYGPMRIRCLKSECYPRQSDLTSSDKLSRIYAAGEGIEDAVAAWKISDDGYALKEADIEDVTSAVQQAIDDVSECGEEYREAAEHFGGQGENADRADACEEYARDLESCMSELEDIDKVRHTKEDRADWQERIISQMTDITSTAVGSLQL